MALTADVSDFGNFSSGPTSPVSEVGAVAVAVCNTSNITSQLHYGPSSQANLARILNYTIRGFPFPILGRWSGFPSSVVLMDS